MKSDKKPLLSGYGHYSGIAFQMGLIIFGGTYGGIKLDEHIKTAPLFTIVGSLGGIALAIYIVIKDFIIKKK
jgi:F0F1-type ATP synthase assembly protein I